MTEAAKPRQQLPAPSISVSPPEDEEDLDEDEEELPEQPLLSTKKVEKYDLHKSLKNKELFKKVKILFILISVKTVSQGSKHLRLWQGVVA